MKYFSMFTGIGGFDLAFNRNGHECIGYSEIDKYAIQIYEKNFGKEVKNYGDATQIRPNELPNFDLLCAGFPCQTFSMAGKRKGFEEARGTLFFEIARIVKDKKPKLLLLENVKGLLNHNNGNTFRTILSTIDELGYDAEWQVLNSKNFGVPQNRERVFIIGYLREVGFRQIFPIESTTTGHIKSVEITEFGGFEKQRRVYSTKGISSTLTKTDSDSLLIGEIERVLTPIECERLQGFPDNWTKYGIDNTKVVISKFYDNYRDYCKNKGWLISRQFEKCMESELKRRERG